MIKLSKLPIGEIARITKISAFSQLRQRLLNFGVIPGLDIAIRHIAPMGDPIALQVQSSLFSISLAEAEHIFVKKVN